MLKKVLLALLAVLVVFLGVVALKSPDYMVSREITVRASAEKIFPYLVNSKLMSQWSPWSELDPSAKMSFSGPEEGIGATTSWDEGKQLGTGSAVITEVVPNQKVHTHLEYVKPFSMIQESDMTIQASGEGSTIVWSVRGQNNFIMRMVGMFMNMDQVVGGIFEKGLANLKGLAEK